MMEISIRIGEGATRVAPSTLLGQNLELAADVAPGLLNERLANPRFSGPEDAQTGVARGWQPASRNTPGVPYALTRGISLSGEESQLIQNITGRVPALVQTGRWVRAGERLQVTLWAKAQGHPITVRVEMRPLPAALPAYDTARVTVDAAYWKPYTVTLDIPADDDDAVFVIGQETPGLLWIDQAHLRPQGSDLLREDVLAAFHSLQIPVLRFPGGCISANYHWKHGVGPHQLRPVLLDPVFRWETSYEFGTDEYLAFCLAQGITPQISVNIGTGTPEEAGEWAAYCAAWFRARGVEPPLMYWQIGNEQFGAWEQGNMTGAMYAAALRDFVPAVRAGYPNARIIAVGPETGDDTQAGVTHPWRAPVLDHAADLIDLIALQLYPGGLEQSWQQQADWIEGMVRAAINDCRSRGLDTRLAVTEWNLWQQASHHDDRGFLEEYDVRHGLFTANVLHHFARLAPDLEMANFYNLLNLMGVFISRGPQVQETALAAIFRLYRPAFPGDVLPVEVSDPAIDALALRTPDATWLFLINRGEEEVLLTLPATEAIMLSGTALNGDLTQTNVPVDGHPFTLPPMSLARLQLDPA